MDFGLDKLPICRTRTALDARDRCIFWSCMPRNASVLRWGVLRWGFVDWAANSSTAITKESIDDRHYSSPQQTAHRPLLCRGLHLFLSSPCIRPCSGATCAASFASIIACVRSFCRTHPEKLPILSAIMAVCSSSVIVFGIFRISKANAYVCINVSCVSLSAPINWQRIIDGV